MKKISIRLPSVVFMDTTTGFHFIAVQLNTQAKTVELVKTYPLIRVEFHQIHTPFYTGRQKFTQADGRGSFQQKNTVQ